MSARKRRLEILVRQVEELRSSINGRTSVPDLRVPDIIEFCLSPSYLNLGILYPRQATLLKLIFLQTDLFTGFDFDTIEQYGRGFTLPDADALGAEDSLCYEGQVGLPPDILERLAVLKAEGRPWVPECVFVGGRRGGKGYIGAIAASYVTFTLLALGDPQAEFGIAPGKTLAGLIFAGNQKQARDLQWFDLAEMVVRAPCFAPFIADVGRDLLTIATPADLDRPGGISAGSVHVMAKEATPMAGRGPAAYLAMFDELAHVSATTSKVSSEDLYGNTLPALDQSGKYGFVYSGSSPWQKIGAFHTNYLRGLEVDRRTHQATEPEVFVCQLPSWSPYEDWEDADYLWTVPTEVAESRPGYTVDGEPVMRHFPRLKGPIQAYDEKLQRRERRDPIRFAVEYRAQWATVMDAFLNPSSIATMFGPYEGEVLVEQHQGQHGIRYVAHGDPATVHDNFVWMIAHYERTEEQDLPDVIVDKIRVWRPGEFKQGHIEYLTVLKDILEDYKAFNIVDTTFDQYQATTLVELLQAALQGPAYPFQPQVREISQGSRSNRAMADIFRPALNLGQVHCYPHELLSDELHFLQDINGKVDHPSSGPVQTNDAATCLMILVERLLDRNSDQNTFDKLRSTSLRGMPGIAVSSADRAVHDQLSALSGRRTEVPVGQRAYPGGPKRLPRWAQG